MDVVVQLLLLILGFVAVLKGADWLVEGASSLAKKRGVSELAIGLTVVAFGTSAPELAVNIQANSEIVFGNTIGSNNFNLLLILGCAGLVYPLHVQRKTVFVDIPLSLGVLLLMALLVNDTWFGHSENILTFMDGLWLVIAFGLFVLYVFRTSRMDVESEGALIEDAPLPKTLLFLILGIAGLVIGGKLVVNNASGLASYFGVSDTIIGLTIVSLGTSLPELATTVVAAYKKRPGLAVGNVIGSNIFNILLVMGISSLVKPLNYSNYLNTDVLLLGAATLGLFVVLALKPKKVVGRIESSILTALFAGYMIYVLNRELHWF